MSEIFRPSKESATETGADTDSPESDDSKNKKEKGKTKKARLLGGIVAKGGIEAAKEPKADNAVASDSLWQKITGQAPTGPAAEKSAGRSHDAPVEQETIKDGATAADRANGKQAGPKLESRDTGLESNPQATEILEASEVAEDAGEDEESQKLDDTQEIARLVAKSRLDEVHNESKDADQENQTKESAAADAIAAAFLSAIPQKIAEQPGRPAEEIVNEAELEAVETINAENGEPNDAEVVEDTEIIDIAPGPDESHKEADEDSRPAPAAQPAASGGGGSNGSNGSHGFSGSGGYGGSGGSNSSSGSGSGNVPPIPPVTPIPPFGPGSAGHPNASPGPLAYHGGYNTAPASTNFASATAGAGEQTYRNASRERRAAAQGLMVGGIVGYLIGKRRGRIKTEKKLAPIRQKLEAQVQSLTNLVAAKEQRLRAMAAEKAAAMPSTDQKKRFVEKLNPAPAAEVVAAEKHKVSKVERAGQAVATAGKFEKVDNVPRPEISSKEQKIYKSERVYQSENAAKPTAETFFSGADETDNRETLRKDKLPPSQAELLGRIIVEAPAVLVGAAAGAAAAESVSRRAEVAVNFNKKVENYSAQELKQASEKIRIDGVTLKDIQQTHNLNENSVRRITAKFIEGGNVREALNREILETELKYERDPRMRQVQAAGGSQAAGTSGNAGGAAASAGAAVLGLLGVDKEIKSAGSSPGSPPAGRPVPDAATLEKLRKKQSAEVAAVSVSIILFFGLIIALIL